MMKKLISNVLIISLSILLSACAIPDLPGPIGIPGL